MMHSHIVPPQDVQLTNLHCCGSSSHCYNCNSFSILVLQADTGAEREFGAMLRDDGSSSSSEGKHLAASLPARLNYLPCGHAAHSIASHVRYAQQ
jgi:hypothetical protein